MCTLIFTGEREWMPFLMRKCLRERLARIQIYRFGINKKKIEVKTKVKMLLMAQEMNDINEDGVV